MSGSSANLRFDAESGSPSIGNNVRMCTLEVGAQFAKPNVASKHVMRLVILSPCILNDDKLGYFAHVFSNANIQVVGALIHKPNIVGPAFSGSLIWTRVRSRGPRKTIRRIVYHKMESSFHLPIHKKADEYFEERNIPTLISEEKYSASVVDFIRSKSPDALFRTGWGIIKEPLLSLTPIGVLSYHHGDIRRYRGMPPCFWQLYHNESSMKVTVQILSGGLDCGLIVKEKAIPIGKSDTLKTLHRRAYTETYSMASEAMNLLNNKRFQPVQLSQEELGPIYSTPMVMQLVALHWKVLFRRIIEFGANP